MYLSCNDSTSRSRNMKPSSLRNSLQTKSTSVDSGVIQCEDSLQEAAILQALRNWWNAKSIDDWNKETSTEDVKSLFSVGVRIGTRRTDLVIQTNPHYNSLTNQRTNSKLLKSRQLGKSDAGSDYRRSSTQQNYPHDWKYSSCKTIQQNAIWELYQI